MSKMVGKQYLNSKCLNGILNGSENHKKPVGKVNIDGKWYSLFAATFRDGKVRTTREGHIELNIREQAPRVPAEPIADPGGSYQEAWSDE